MKNGIDPQPLVGEVRMLRIRVAAAESKLKGLREQARQAKRRRKEAKRIAQRARKQFKRAKADVSDLKRAVAKAESKLYKAGGRALAAKMGGRKRVGRKTSDRAAKKPKAPARKRRAAPPAALHPRPALPRKPRVTGRVTRETPAITATKAVSNGPAVVAPPDPTPATPRNPGPNS